MLAARLLEECRAPLPGPVHANQPFREPLLPGSASEISAPPPLPASPILHAGKPPVGADIAALAAELSGRPGLIICGEGTFDPAFAVAVVALADKLEVPILAEPLANLRFGTHDRSRILTHQAHFLKQPGLPAPDWVLRFGAFPVSRTLERYLASLESAHHVLIAPPGRWPDPLWHSDRIVHADPIAVTEALPPLCRPASADFFSAWRAAEDADAHRTESLCAAETLFEGSVARTLLDALPSGTHCFVGNSLAIRAVDAFSGTAEKPLTLHGNRGTSGIDGNLATATGIAAATRQRLAVLVGDQTALHDCSSLALLAQGNNLVVVMDNGGGGIFDHLPFAGALPEALLRRGWTAPPNADFAALAAAFGLRYAEADSATQLHEVLQTALSESGAWLVRVVIDHTASRAQFL
jgi:2-succinyl-5-enolpyruvyl-6-hydroxy-3-cyclohexene-1-carboxylate synthase